MYNISNTILCQVVFGIFPKPTVACMGLHTSTCEISAISANWFLRKMQLPSAHAHNGSEQVEHQTLFANYCERLNAICQQNRSIGSSET